MQYGSANVPMMRTNNPTPARDEEIETLICDCLDLLLSTLPADQASVVRAVDMKGALPQVVAEAQKFSLDEVTAHLALGRKNLRDRFFALQMIRTHRRSEGGCCPSKGEKEF